MNTEDETEIKKDEPTDVNAKETVNENEDGKKQRKRKTEVERLVESANNIKF